MAVTLHYFSSLLHYHKRTIYTVVGVTAAYVFFMKVFKKKRPPCYTGQILEKNWKKDRVYLYQFPRAKFLPNHCPFALKLEALMKLYSIPYEIRTIKDMSWKPPLPAIELNGEHLSHNKMMERRILEYFKIPNLSPEEEAIAYPICLMLENNTYPIMLKNKLVDHPENISLFIDVFEYPAVLRYPLQGMKINAFKKRITLFVRAMLGGMFTDADLKKLLKEDLKVLNNVLGDKKFILGDKITQPDCTVFAQLATLYYLPTENDTKQLITTEFPALGRYVDRVRAHIFGEKF